MKLSSSFVVATLSVLASWHAAPAVAGPYSDAVRIEEGCDANGQLGAMAFAARPVNAGQMSQTDLESAAEAWMSANNLMARMPNALLARIAHDTVIYAFTKAPDARNAYGHGWGECMDEYGPQ